MFSFCNDVQIEGESFYSNKTFLKIGNRLFYIGRRTIKPSKSFTYDLKDDEKSVLFESLSKRKIEIDQEIDYKLCKIDKTTVSNRACCIVIISLGDRKYNVKNFNSRAVTEDTAIKIRDYFRQKNIKAAVEYLGEKSIKLTRYNVRLKKNEQEVIKDLQKDQVRTNEQLSLFDFKKINDN